MTTPVSPDGASPDRSLKTTALNLLTSIRWALRLTWSTSPLLVSGVVISTCGRALIPAGLALTARGLINGLVGLLNRGSDDFSVLIPWLLLGFGLAAVQAMSDVTSRYLIQRLNDDLHLKITADILTHAAGLDIAFFEDHRFHDAMERARQDTAKHFSQFLISIIAVVNNALQLGSLLAILIVIEPFIAAILAPVALPYLFFQVQLAKRRHLKEQARTTGRRWASYFVRLLTSPQSAAEVRLLDLAPLLIDRYRTLVTEFRDQDRKLHWRGFLESSSFALLAAVVFYLIFGWVVYRALKAGLTIGDVTIYAGASSVLRSNLANVIQSMSSAVEHALFVSNLKEFLNIRPWIQDTGSTVPVSRQGGIEFTHVSFYYPGSSQLTLSDVSFRIEPGETVALVGENGAGKTTLVKLIARLYDPDNGCITLDGVDIRELPVSYLYSQLACVLQGFGRYEATAADNIAYGDWRRLLHDQDQVKEIAREANIQEMIEDMPQAYETMLGKMFGKYDLSAGQWQQLAVARAFARDACVLILDEPTASLDARAEHAIFSRFRELLKGRTTILISHRFSTVSIADRILVLDQGRLIEQGTHQELMTLNGHYATLYKLHERQIYSR
ncbi:ABC transporter ATP-binding protein [Candidatus Methylomirabilis sp.]